MLTSKSTFIALSLALGLFMLCEMTWAVEREQRKQILPNIVLIMVDDMGYGDPQFNNPESKIRTPHLDALASGGMRFTDAHAAGPLCHLSRYGLMTGRYPFRAQVQLWPTQPVIEPGQATVASMLKASGYRTAMVGKWHLGFAENGYDQLLPGGPVDVGFDSFFGIRASTDIPPYFYIRDSQAVLPPTIPIEAKATEGWSPIQGEFWRAGLIAKDMQLADVLPRFSQEAIAVIEQHSTKENPRSSTAAPLFLYLAYPAPHTPWLPAAEFAGRSRVGLYGDFVEMVDAEVGRVRAALTQAGMSEDTLFLFTSDNGPVWYARDVERFAHDACGGLRGMKSDAWEAGHRMPFVVSWPGRIPADSTSQQLISFTDVFATLAAIVGYELQPDEAPDSFDFSSCLLAEPLEDTPPRNVSTKSLSLRTTLPLRSGGGLMTYRRGDWKLIDGLGSGGFSLPRKVTATADGPRVQLYDLARDASERNNQALAEPQLAEQLRLEMQAVLNSDAHRRQAASPAD